MKNRKKGLVLAVTGGFLALGALGLSRNVSVGLTPEAMAASDDAAVKVLCTSGNMNAFVADPTFSLSFSTSSAGLPTVSAGMVLSNAVAGDVGGTPSATMSGAGNLVIDVASPFGKANGFQCQGLNKIEHTAFGYNSVSSYKVGYRSATGADGSTAGSFYSPGAADTALSGSPRHIASDDPTAIMGIIFDGGLRDNDGVVNAEVVDGGNATAGAYNLQLSLPVSSLATGSVEEVITHSYVLR